MKIRIGEKDRWGGRHRRTNSTANHGENVPNAGIAAHHAAAGVEDCLHFPGKRLRPLLCRPAGIAERLCQGKDDCATNVRQKS